MDRQDRVVVVPADGRIVGPATPGMERQQAFATEGMWAGHVRTEPGMVSGWHHHGEFETAVYVLSGALRFESGSGGVDVADAGPGDFALVPKGVVHRESNPSDDACDVTDELPALDRALRFAFGIRA
ncbi:MAG: cupin domain-containing protein [Actinomycetota bacterium]